MKIYMIWAQDNYGHAWLVDAWDDDSVAENYTGWQEALAKAKLDEDEYTTIRVVTGEVDMDKVYAAFEPSHAGTITGVESAVEV